MVSLVEVGRIVGSTIGVFALLALWMRSRTLSALAYRIYRIRLFTHLMTVIGLASFAGFVGVFYNISVIEQLLAGQELVSLSLGLGLLYLAYACLALVALSFVVRQFPEWDKASGNTLDKIGAVDEFGAVWIGLARERFGGGMFGGLGAILFLVIAGFNISSTEFPEWTYSAVVFGLGIAGILLTGLLGGGRYYIKPDEWPIDAEPHIERADRAASGAE